jgi:hypothetical protein
MARIITALALSGILAFTGVSAAENALHTDAGKGGTRLTSAVSFVPMAPLTAATPLGRSIGGMISAEFSFDIPDARLRTRALAMRPRLQDALRGALTEYGSSHYRPGGAPDPTQLCAMAQIAVDRAVGGPGVKVLIANVMITERR